MKFNKAFGKVTDDNIQGVLGLLLEKRIGWGGHRTVYQLFGEPDFVLKVEHHHHVEANIIEHNLWRQWDETKEGKRWLAKCYKISENGRALLQEKLEIFTSVDDPRLPKRTPRLFTDQKIQNWGVAKDGTVKCCDYGMVLTMQGNPWQLTKADWWDAKA